MSTGCDVTDGRPGALAMSVNERPVEATARSSNEATPFLVVRVRVPASETAPAGDLTSIVMSMGAVAVLPASSRASTRTAGANATPSSAAAQLDRIEPH